MDMYSYCMIANYKDCWCVEHMLVPKCSLRKSPSAGSTEGTTLLTGDFQAHWSLTSIISYAHAATMASVSMPYFRYKSGMSPAWPKDVTPSGATR